MINKQNTKQKIETLKKTRIFLAGGSVSCMFLYVIFLGLTSANVVTLKNLSKNVEDFKNELSTVELSYMTDENIIALETRETSGWSHAENISYVNVGKNYDINTVAIAKNNR